jgi:hypothetical protein
MVVSTNSLRDYREVERLSDIAGIMHDTTHGELDSECK